MRIIPLLHGVLAVQLLSTLLILATPIPGPHNQEQSPSIRLVHDSTQYSGIMHHEPIPTEPENDHARANKALEEWDRHVKETEILTGQPLDTLQLNLLSSLHAAMDDDLDYLEPSPEVASYKTKVPQVHVDTTKDYAEYRAKHILGYMRLLITFIETGSNDHIKRTAQENLEWILRVEKRHGNSYVGSKDLPVLNRELGDLQKLHPLASGKKSVCGIEEL
ncbi:hypothetical protein H0H93_011583 [Arthromyces matolae]|nr:hypothetical protein H0H93_011583 [Arthromyces matolae]